MISGNFLEISIVVWIRESEVPSLIRLPGVPHEGRTLSARNPIRIFLHKKRLRRVFSYLL